MSGESSVLMREIEDFKASTGKLSEKINSIGDIWKDSNYSSLQVQIGELAKNSRTVIESSNKTISNTNSFFTIAEENV